VTEQRQAQAQMVEQQRALAMLGEREQLARELHDGLGQVFAFVNTQGQTVRRLLSRGDTATADALVDRLVEVAREADVDIRESILGLRETLSERGLLSAVADYLKQYEKNYGIQVASPAALPGRGDHGLG
jgi:nitrate/nitrite-specific signal transduction histidine kinase